MLSGGVGWDAVGQERAVNNYGRTNTTAILTSSGPVLEHEVCEGRGGCQ